MSEINLRFVAEASAEVTKAPVPPESTTPDEGEPS